MDDTTFPRFADAEPAWLDTDSLLPTEFRDRVRAALDAAGELQRATEAFADEHGSVFGEYAALAKSANVEREVWEVLDRTSGYARLWIMVLATEALLASLLEVLPTAAVMPAAVRPDR